MWRRRGESVESGIGPPHLGRTASTSLPSQSSLRVRITVAEAGLKVAAIRRMDRALLEEHLAQAERHVTEGEYHVGHQRAVIEDLTKRGHDTREAENLLREFERTLALHEAARDHTLDELVSNRLMTPGQ
jgi:hypothetical protein